MRPSWLRQRPRKAKEGPCLVEHLLEGPEAAVQADEVEEIAMLAGGGVGPFASGAGAAVAFFEPHKQAAPGRVGDIAHEPVIADAPSAGEIVTAHRLGLAREAARQLGCRAR